MRHVWKDDLEFCEEIRHQRGMKELYKKRKETIERLFGTAKEYHNLRYTREKGKSKMEDKVGLTLACLNIKKLVKWIANIPFFCSKSDFMFSSIEQLCKLFPKEALKTFTSDRGKEFACYPLVENLGISFFFADACSSWHRGSNENANGLLREYFPKKTDLATISEEALSKALYDINHRPHKCLAYRTACEALEDELE